MRPRPMRSLSILFLFVALAFVMYSSMIYVTIQNAPSGGVLISAENTAKTSRMVSNSREILNLTVSNDSAVVGQSIGLTNTKISYEGLLNTIEVIIKLNLLIIALSVFLLVITSLVVK